MGAKQKRETGDRTCSQPFTHYRPPSPSPWGLAIYNTGLSPLAPTLKISPQKIKTFFKKYSICLRNLREFLYWSWKKKNQPGFQPKPLPGGVLSVTALPLQPRVYIKLGEGVENKRCHLAQIRASSPKNRSLTEGVSLKWLFCSGAPFSPSSQLSVPQYGGWPAC